MQSDLNTLIVYVSCLPAVMITYVSCLPAVRVLMYYIGVVMSFHMNTKIAIQILKLHLNWNGGSIL